MADYNCKFRQYIGNFRKTTTRRDVKIKGSFARETCGLFRACLTTRTALLALIGRVVWKQAMRTSEFSALILNEE